MKISLNTKCQTIRSVIINYWVRCETKEALCKLDPHTLISIAIFYYNFLNSSLSPTLGIFCNNIIHQNVLCNLQWQFFFCFSSFRACFGRRNAINWEVSEWLFVIFKSFLEEILILKIMNEIALSSWVVLLFNKHE